MAPESIGVKDSYFHLGGNSIKVISLSARIRREFGADIKVAKIFKRNTIEEQAKLLWEEEAGQKAVNFGKAETKESYHASNAQKRIYLANKLRNDDTGYNIPQVFKVTGELDAERLQEVLQEITDTQTSLRTSFKEIDGEIKQKVEEDIEIVVEKKSIRRKEIEGEIESFIRPFDLEKAPLWRVGLYQIIGGEKESLLLEGRKS